MKTRIVSAFVMLGLTQACLLTADAGTNAHLKAVAEALAPAFANLDPIPTAAYPKHTTSLVITHLPQTYKIHGRSKTGEVSTNVYDQVGPSFRGFVLRVHLQDKGVVNQAGTPQTIREPYWVMDLDVTPIASTDKQIYWALSYCGRTDTNILTKIRRGLNELSKEPNKTNGE